MAFTFTSPYTIALISRKTFFQGLTMYLIYVMVAPSVLTAKVDDCDYLVSQLGDAVVSSFPNVENSKRDELQKLSSNKSCKQRLEKCFNVYKSATTMIALSLSSQTRTLRSRIEEGRCDHSILDKIIEMKGISAQCPKGTIPNGAKCMNCPKGQTSYLLSKECRHCDPGQFSSSEGSPHCEFCPAGTIAASKGKSSCDTCSSGEYSDNEGKKCLPCPENHYSTASSSECTPCPDGKISGKRSKDSTYCVNKENCDSLIEELDDIFYAVNNTDTKARRQTVERLQAGDIITQTCRSTQRIIELGFRTSCQPGHVFDMPSSTCTQCPPGSHAPKQRSRECIPCAPGYYAPDSGTIQCSACSSYTVSAAGSIACVSCSANQYMSDENGVRVCAACPVGTTAPAGNSAKESCIDITACETLITKVSKLADKSAATSESSLVAACGGLNGFSQRFDEAFKLLVCAEGSFASGNSTCKPCQPGSFAQVKSATACKLCPAGMYASSEGSITCKPCDVGTYSNVEGSVTCRQCAIGTYTNSKGSKRCTLLSWQNAALAVGTTGAIATGALLLNDSREKIRFEEKRELEKRVKVKRSTGRVALIVIAAIVSIAIVAGSIYLFIQYRNSFLA